MLLARLKCSHERNQSICHHVRVKHDSGVVSDCGVLEIRGQ
jgi:hypothetical protein